MQIVGKIIAGVIIAFLCVFVIYEGYQLTLKIIQLVKDKKNKKVVEPNNDSKIDSNN